MQYTLIIFSENKPGVLYRIADLFLRRKINIDSLTVSETERTGISRFTIVVDTDGATVEKVVKQLYRIVEVVKVSENTQNEVLSREIALIKVVTETPEKRKEVESLATLLKADITSVGADFLTLQKSGPEEEIDSLLLLMRPFGIREFVRSGKIALVRKDEKPERKLIKEAPQSSYVASSIDVSVIKKMELLARAKKDVVSLAQGIPSFPTPLNIKQAAKEAIDNGLSDKYTPGYGIEPLRVAMADKIKRFNKIDTDPSRIITTHGAIEGVMATFMAILNPDDEIAILTPDYASHITQARIARNGAHPVSVPLKETEKGWVLDSKRLEAAITARTKAILVCNPCNPTGKVYSYEELKEIARIALQYNLFIVTDETYEEFVFDGKEHISIGSFPEVADRVISLFTVSKTYSMTGWRIGYLTAQKAIVDNIFKIHDSLVTCPTAVSQYAALEALTGDQSAVGEFRQTFIKRRQMVIDAIAKTDVMKLTVPQGGYFAFPRFVKPVDEYELALKILDEANVAVIPGSPFGLGGENHLRISFGTDDITLQLGLDRLVGFLKKM